MNICVLSKKICAVIFVGTILLLNVNIPKAKANWLDDAAKCETAIKSGQELTSEQRRYCNQVLIQRDYLREQQSIGHSNIEIIKGTQGRLYNAVDQMSTCRIITGC